MASKDKIRCPLCKGKEVWLKKKFFDNHMVNVHRQEPKDDKR